MIIHNLPNYQLKLTLTPEPRGGLWSLELHQHFPQAQRPRWQRLVQLNLPDEALDRIAQAVTERK